MFKAMCAMNEALKQDRFHSKEHDPHRVFSSNSLSSTTQHCFMTFNNLFGLGPIHFEKKKKRAKYQAFFYNAF
jgi:hypothetical protein